MRLLAIGIVFSLIGIGSARAEAFDPVTGLSVKDLVEIENSLSENFGVTDFESYVQKRDQLQKTVETLENQMAKGLILEDPATGRSAASIVQEDLDKLESLYSSLDPTWRARIELKETFGISTYQEFRALVEKFQTRIDEVDVRAEDTDNLYILSPGKVQYRAKLMARLNQLKELGLAVNSTWLN